NTSFMGYPLLQALHGEAGLTLAVVADQLGCFPLLASVGVVVACLYAGRDPDPRRIARRIATFPAFIALVVGIVAGVLGGWPAVLDGVFHPLGATLTPLALFSAGPQFRLQEGERQLGAAARGLGWKLLQAAMAPMVSATILADEYELDPELANTVLGAGIVLSLLTVPLGNWLLGA